MERKITAKLIDWKNSEGKKSLIVTGCRQVGKTYSIIDFAKTHYSSHIYINFEIMQDVAKLFDGNLDADTIFEKLIMYSNVKTTPGSSLIILDEIQRCSAAISSLKSMTLDGRYDVIASGSLLGINLDTDGGHLSPLGYVDIIEMQPMDFEEFLWAMGANKDLIEMIRGCIRMKTPIDKYFLKKITDLFKRYIVVGGMPEAVAEYASSKDYVKTRGKLKKILGVLEMDASRYSGKLDAMKILSCLHSVPEQLAKGNSRFVYSDVEKKSGTGKREYQPSLMWLEKAGMIDFCYNLREPVAPLATKTVESSFKVYMKDTGLLMTLMDDADANAIVNGDVLANNGAPMENAVSCAIRNAGYPLRFYAKADSTLEVDFIINAKGTVNAIEVKSGTNKRAKSLTTLTSERKNIRGIKISDTNIFTDENGIDNYPLFAPCFFEVADSSIEPPNYIDDMNARFMKR